MKIYDLTLSSRKLDFQKQKSLPCLHHFKSTGAGNQNQKFSTPTLTGQRKRTREYTSAKSKVCILMSVQDIKTQSHLHKQVTGQKKVEICYGKVYTAPITLQFYLVPNKTSKRFLGIVPSCSQKFCQQVVSRVNILERYNSCTVYKL